MYAEFKFFYIFWFQIQKILHSNLQMSVPPVFNDYITLAGDLKKSPESKNWVIAKFTANAIGKCFYMEWLEWTISLTVIKQIYTFIIA